ncbi:DNA-directed RNA polymerase subunit beta [Elysia marginata]|uniref:DNA-directed RNA polymerase n=1 Tax=Elysia marginata TaxID=1093978 RepID=A0AAV4GSP2_9GAST|nr:DNA-directed RNA polymerase subunit beta [Elysia marginata]
MADFHTRADGKPEPLATAEDLRPQASRPPITTIDNAALTEADMMQFIVAAVDSEGLVGHNIKDFNDLINEGIPQILTELFDVTNVVKDLREQTEMDRLRESVKINFRFTDVKVGRPVYAAYPIGKTMALYPNESRLNGRTYAAPLSLAAEVVMTAHYADAREETKRAEIPPFMIAAIPMMVGADRCHTWNLTREARKNLEEDPNESGGYFLAKGSEWVVEWLENISFNMLHVHKRMQANERVRGEFISQPGGAFENSSQVIIRYMVNTSLTIEINSTKFSKTRIPFFLIFRLLGMTSDANILQQIVYDPASASPVVRHMVDTVGRALRFEDAAYSAIHNELNREKLTEFMAVRLSKFVTNPTAYKSNEHAIQYLNDNLLGIMDRFLLPHIGRDASSRGLKLRYLGMLIHKTLLVDMGILEPTDRDNYSNKRVHGSGVSIAKAFKTQFNNSVVVPVMRALKREIRNTPFEELSIPNIIDAFKNPMASSDLGRTLEQAITSGNKTIVVRRRAVVNRVSTQALERKNPANYYSALRAVSTHNASKASKQTERADKMRRVHASYTGYICVAKSADTGEMVGMKKELAITASVCRAGEAYPLILRLKEDPAITLASEVQTPDLIRKNLACIFVNGAWIGCCASAHELVGRYRLLRREGRIVGPQTSIVWNPVTDDIDFLLDAGRLTRPLIIVDNNIEDYDAAARAVFAGKPGAKRVEFLQNIRLTPAHIASIRAGELTLEDLRASGIVEWISPQEAENCLVAPSLDVLRANARNVAMRYTHCDVEQAIFGLTALVSPFGNHTQPARVTYETNQGRQAGGWYSFAAPYRVDKNRFFQHYCEAPLVRTIAYNWLFPNGMNTIVAYMINDGYNQEDSAVVKKGFIQRGGFAGAFYRFEKAELEKGEFFGSPDITTTKNLKPNASYEKLVDGFVPPGTVVHKGDVLIGRVAKIQASSRRGSSASNVGDDGYKFVDRSVVYHLAEPAIVTDVFCPRGPNDNIFGLVKLRYHRPLGVGDKLCLTPDHDVLTERGWVPIADVTLSDTVAALAPGGILCFEKPTELFEYDHDGDLYEIETQAVSLRVTLGHRMYVQELHPAGTDSGFRLISAKDIFGKPVRYKRDAINLCEPLGVHVCLGGMNGPDVEFSMDVWARLLGLFISDGRALEGGQVLFGCKRPCPRSAAFLFDAAGALGLQFAFRAKPLFQSIIHSRQVCDDLRPLSVEAANRRLPEYVWSMSSGECRTLLNALVGCDDQPPPLTTYYTPSPRLADDIMRLALHAGWSASMWPFGPSGAGTAKHYSLQTPVARWRVTIVRAKNQRVSGPLERITPYRGKIHCLTVPSHVFYVRRHGRPSWTGNSSRAGNKSIVAIEVPEADLPFDEDGVTPDIVINPHCLAGESPVTLACGLSRRIDSLSVSGGERVWGWDKTRSCLVLAAQSGLMPKGREPVLRITLEDGRSFRATSGHPFWTLKLAGTGGVWTRAGHLSTGPACPSRICIGFRGPLDGPGLDEAGWRLEAGDFCFTMDTPTAREKALAFSRIVGFSWVAAKPPGPARAFSHPLDAEVFCQDVELLTSIKARVSKKPPTVVSACPRVWTVEVPASLRRGVARLLGDEGCVSCKKASSRVKWPKFLWGAPSSIVREFLAGLFGHGGLAPCFSSRSKKMMEPPADSRESFLSLEGVAFTRASARFTPKLLQSMEELACLLERVGVVGAQSYGPIWRAKGETLAQYGVRVPASPLFTEKVGFRYCVQKTSRLEAASAYWRKSTALGAPHAFGGTTPLGTLGGGPKPLPPKAKDVDNVFEDPEAFFRAAGCLGWFSSAGVEVCREKELSIPGFSLRVVDVCADGEAEVYDIGVPGPTSYCANGAIASNSLPSRMTIGQMLETSLSIRCQEEGCLTDGTSFRKVSVDEISRELADIGLRFNGLTRLYNGRTGEHYDAAIFMGPTYHQRLQKFVKDDEYAVGGYGPTDALTGQPLEGKNARGGLRLGEMEAWVLESHGSMMSLTEKMIMDSDGRKMFVCRTCGAPAIYNAYQGIYRCTTCNENADIGSVDSCKASIVFQHELRSANVKVTLGIRPREFEDYA